VAAALVGLASCAASEPSLTEPAPSGSLGVVTVEAARRAVSALCEIAAQEGTDRDAANASFYDRAHQTLHVIAAAVEVRDRAAAAALQQDKGVVEEDLARERLPRSFADDVRTLVSGTRDALARVGIDVPPCPS
jgi:broad specificity phosphatase PhoE